MVTVLVAEDDKNTRLLTTLRLKPYYTVENACNGKEALDLIHTKHIDLVVADIMMPVMDGYTLVKKLREENATIPIIMLTAKQTITDKRTGFSCGTDDYLTKPVDYEELVMRIDALLRRAKIAGDKKIVIGSIIIDSSSYTITTGNSKTNETISLPKKEFDLLYLLLSYPNEIFTKEVLMEKIWGNDSNSDEDTVKTHISRLRTRFESWPEFSIETLRGLGYRAIINGEKNERKEIR